MKIIFIGCVRSSYIFLETLLKVPEAEVVGIVTRTASKFNADFVSLEGLANKFNIPCFLTDSNDSTKLYGWMKNKSADIIYCFGWSYLLNKNLIKTARLGGLGYHPAKLPANRGRHPIIWTLVLGLHETASTFFFLTDKADAGDIISQEIVAVSDTDDASSLYDKLMKIGKKQVVDFTQKLARGNYSRIPQDDTKSNNWRKRTYKDGLIDWRMSARGIYNLVRGLTHPYVGADFIYNDREIKVWKSEIVSENTIYENLEPGKILKLDSSGIEIQCGLGVIRLIEFDNFDVKVGDYL